MASQRRLASQSGVQIEGFDEAMRALRRYSKAVDKEVKGVLREEAKFLRKEAWKREPGGGDATVQTTTTGKRTVPRWTMSKVIGFGVNSRGAQLVLNARKWNTYANVMEFGESKSYIPINRGDNKRGSVRSYPGEVGGAATAKPHKPPTTTNMYTNRGGYMLGPTFRKWLPVVEERVQDELVELWERLNHGTTR